MPEPITDDQLREFRTLAEEFLSSTTRPPKLEDGSISYLASVVPSLVGEIERLTRERDAAYILHDYQIKSGRECCPCGVAADRNLARAEKAEAALERVRSEQMHAVKTLAIATMGVGGEVSVTQFIGYPEPRDAQLLVIQLPEQEAPTDEALDGE